MSAVRRFGKYVLLILAVLLLLAGLAGCVANISQQDLLKQLLAASPPLVLDVRTPGEYREGHVPGAVNISVFDFRSPFEQMDPPKDKPIVVICEHGPRSSFAGFMLKSAGYMNVLELDGAMKAWKKNNLPMKK